jgi:regulator of protease activity HflC (stomatin/prohibitin superfamily)
MDFLTLTVLVVLGFCALAILLPTLIRRWIKSSESPKISFNGDHKMSLQNKAGSLLLVIGLATLAFWILGLLPLTVVPAGTVGVADTFGTVNDAELRAGMHPKLPWTHVEVMTVKTQEFSNTITTLTSEGLPVDLDVTVLYRMNPNEASDVYQEVGANYQDVIVRPQIRSVLRDVAATFTAKSLYSAEKTVVAIDVDRILSPILEDRGIVLESVLLRDVRLPEDLTKAFEAKLVAEQRIQEKEFEVETQRMEAERVRVEAEGIRDAQKIIDESLTPEYLQWKAIEMMQNRDGATYYIPIGENGLPMVKTIGE